MKSLMLRVGLLFLTMIVDVQSQTTTISASALHDPSGNLLTGSACFGSALYSPTTCQNITAGVLLSFNIANGTYVVWVNEGSATIFSVTGAVLSGGSIDADTYFNGLYAVSVGGALLYLPGLNIGFSCNGNTVTLPMQPTNYQSLHIANRSTTTACTIAGNTQNFLYQAATVTSESLAAGDAIDIIYVQNYDLAGAGHNAWLVSHLGT